MSPSCIFWSLLFSVSTRAGRLPRALLADASLPGLKSKAAGKEGEPGELLLGGRKSPPSSRGTSPSSMKATLSAPD